jgi:hypothetical protein
MYPIVFVPTCRIIIKKNNIWYQEWVFFSSVSITGSEEVNIGNDLNRKKKVLFSSDEERVKRKWVAVVYSQSKYYIRCDIFLEIWGIEHVSYLLEIPVFKSLPSSSIFSRFYWQTTNAMTKIILCVYIYKILFILYKKMNRLSFLILS